MVQRLALSYAPGSARTDTLTLLALDTRLADILRQRSEPLIAQLKLAWWRDRLREEPAHWPGGEPLLARLAGWRNAGALVGLVDGWEALLAETLSEPAMLAFADGRAAGWQVLADRIGDGSGADDAGHTARGWALADLALHLSAGAEADLARVLALEHNAGLTALPRALRPLAVLRGLALRAVRRGSGEALDGPGAAILALRIGLAGR